MLNNTKAPNYPDSGYTVTTLTRERECCSLRLPATERDMDLRQPGRAQRSPPPLDRWPPQSSVTFKAYETNAKCIPSCARETDQKVPATALEVEKVQQTNQRGFGGSTGSIRGTLVVPQPATTGGNSRGCVGSRHNSVGGSAGSSGRSSCCAGVERKFWSVPVQGQHWRHQPKGGRPRCQQARVTTLFLVYLLEVGGAQRRSRAEVN